jgi:signal transduction histidine kinase
LAAAAVHEINNPIQGILTFAKLMRNSLDSKSVSDSDLDKFRTYLELIANESSRCGQILRNLLSFSRQNELKNSSVGLKELFSELELLLGNRMDLQKITLDKNIPDNLDPIRGDRDQLKQVLLNILLNAIESMADGGIVSIHADQHIVNGYIRIQIQDKGVGIPHNVQDKVFEPFFSTKTESKGVGLGLSVVYGIIAQHGGTIEFESKEGKGTTVILTLPSVKNRPDELES